MNTVEEQFSNLYDQYIDKIYRFVLIKVSTPEIAEDLTAETFLRGWEAIKKRSNPHPRPIDHPSAFLYKIARNLVIDYYRKKSRLQFVPVEDVQIDDPREDVEKKAILGSDMANIRKALDGIKEEYKEVIIWHYLDELQVPEIARIINKSEGNVRVLLHRALNSLRAQIDPTDRIKEI